MQEMTVTEEVITYVAVGKVPAKSGCFSGGGISERNEKIVLYSYFFIIAFLYYGFLPGIQSYSTLPYGMYNTRAS